MRSWVDSSGGNDNLVVFRKDAIGARIYQAAYGANTAYTTYKDVVLTSGSIVSNYIPVWMDNSSSLSSSVIFQSAGNIGIGTTSPSTILTVGNTGTDNGGITVFSTNTSTNYDILKGQRQYPRMTLIDSGSTAGATFQIWNLGSELRFGTTAGSSTVSSFNVLAGETGSVKFNGSIAIGNITPSATKGRIDATNDVVAYSTSDIHFKTNITPISGALDKITQIGGYEFDWIPDVDFHGFEGHDVGVIAQEIEKVLPEVVKKRDSGYKAVKYEKIVPLLIEAIKEQQKQIEDLQKQVNYLVENKT